ncbi:response regulator transcription factor [Sphingomonas sp.]|uniref:winged helix-turn-helix domain-containing protein n=1 Tax=Sphingomonas sp. TaxID=28214 RepID=UPI0025D83D12|nr:response regulator transcription factor [Sphingomonas sp.]
MGGIIASAIEVPELAAAAAARGLRLVPLAHARPTRDAAALIAHRDGDPERAVAEARASGWIGPLMLALTHEAWIVRALDAGADDAVLLPASAGEIAARLAARLRTSAAAPIEIGELRIEPVERRVTRAGRALDLLPREYALLLCLARHPGEVVSRAELLAQVWRLGFDPGTNVVQVHVSRLRAKLDKGFARPMLVTDKGRGYRLIA